MHSASSEDAGRRPLSNTTPCSFDIEVPGQGLEQRSVATCVLVYSVALALVATMSGGLIFGSAPFQAAIAKTYGFTDNDATAIITVGFQIFVWGTGLLAPLVDVVGPRISAAGGLLMECLGHQLLLQIPNLDSHRNELVSLAYGLIGLGGTLMFISSINFADLFTQPALATSMMSGAYQAAGFVFMLLSVVSFEALFEFYRVASLLAFVLVLLIYPDKPFTSSSVPKFGLRLKELSGCFAAGENAEQGFAEPLWRRSMRLLREVRTVMFLLGFAWSACCTNWGLATFYQVVTSKDAAGGGSSVGRHLITFMPLVANSTFLFTPCVGALIDRGGFALPVALLGVWVLLFSCSLLLPLQLLWVALGSLNILQALTYCIQITYMSLTYPSDNFGFLMSASTITQALVILGTQYLNDVPTGVAATVFIVPSFFLFGYWASLQHTLRGSGKELHRDE